REGNLSDEGALLLFALHRHRKQKVDLAASLERRARGVPRTVASARLREALGLYSEALGDPAGTARVEAAIGRLEQEQPDLGAGTQPSIAREPDPATRSGAGNGESADPVRAESARDLTGLEGARALEERGEHDKAAARYEALWAAAPDDLRPLEALERLYLARGDADAVSEVLGRMIVVTEDRVRRAALWFRRAKLYRDLLHRDAEAYRCLKEAFANHPDSGDIAHALRMTAMARGEWGLAAELLYREIAGAGDHDDREIAAFYNELGLIYDQKLGDAEQAQRCYEHALRLDPAIPASPKPLARLYELAGRHADASAMYEKAAAHATAEVERGTLLRRAAGCAERAGRDDEADRLLGMASRLAGDAAPAEDLAPDTAPPVSISSESPSARIKLLESQLRHTTDPVLIGDMRRQIIEVAASAGDNDAIERHAAALMAENQADLSAYLALKNQATARGNWKALAGLLQVRAAALENESERADLLCELGRLYDKELSDPGAAVAAYDQVLDVFPSHPVALESLAEIAYLRGDWLRARDLYTRLELTTTTLPPDVFYYRCGEIAEILGQDEEACAAFAESARIFPGSRQALTALARTSLRIGDLGRAIDASRALLDLIPPDDVRAVRAARLQLAELCGRSGDPEAAIGYYEQVLADEPKSITALSSLLALYSEAGDYASAARVLRSLISLTPAPAQRAELLYRLGEMCRRGLGDPDLAADSYLKAIDLDPDHLPTLRRLLDYYWQAGDNKNLLDVARDLDKRGALMDRVMDADALAGAMLVAALRGARELAARTADYFGPSLATAMAGALVEASARSGGPAARDLVGVALELAARAGIDPPRLGAELRRCAGDDPRAAALLAAWAAARS
ncbi:MAG TPA: tetratricopeptide repeat protein, partial [Kofleriaceae bacterium]|nr:tetratricopeptide repeat protein [Kofleriaceae bacterium]